MSILGHLWLPDYGRSAAVVALALSLGYPTCRRILHGPASVPLMALTGLAELSLVVCLLSWLHVFTGTSITIVAVLGATATGRHLIVDVPSWRGARRSAERSRSLQVCLATVAIVTLGFSWFALYPVIASDANNYHLPMAQILVAHHGFHYDRFIRYDFFPQGTEALYAVMLLMSNTATSCGALEFTVLALAAVALPLWFAGSGRRPGSGLVAALVLLASPVVIWTGTVPFVDVSTMVFLLAGLLVGLDAVDGRVGPTPGFVLMGMLLGQAAASKYTAVAFGACAFLGVLVAGGRKRLDAVLVLAGICGSALTALPWYAWTIHVTGDPVYPFLTGLFGNHSGLWTPREIKYQYPASRGISASGPGPILSQDIQYLLGNVTYNTGPGRSPISWWSGVGFLGFLSRTLRRDRTFLGVAVAIVISVVLDVFSSTDPRFAVPIIGFCALLAGLAADPALASIARRARKLTGDLRFAPLWCVLACVAALFSSASYVRWWADSSGGLPPTRAAKVTEYLASELPCYAAVQDLNSRAGSHYRAWGSECESSLFYARGVVISDVFSTGSLLRVFSGYPGVPPPGILWSRLQPLDVGWLILPTSAAERRVLTARRLFRYVATLGPEDLFRLFRLQ